MVSKDDIKVNIIKIDNYILFQAFTILSTQRIITKDEEFITNYDLIIDKIKDEMFNQLKNLQL
jgi:hypothetical protein